MTRMVQLTVAGDITEAEELREILRVAEAAQNAIEAQTEPDDPFGE
jgi:hypothetical protein